MYLKKLTEFLDSHSVKYTTLIHSQAFTARDIATIAHVPRKELAKTVVVKADDRMIMVVVPATDMVDLKLVRKLLGAANVRLADEDEFKELFPDCELGAMPLFGNLYNVDVLAADDLTQDEEIVFNAGTHRELIRMAYKDFERLVQPRIAKISVSRNVAQEEGWRYDG